MHTWILAVAIALTEPSQAEDAPVTPQTPPPSASPPPAPPASPSAPLPPKDVLGELLPTRIDLQAVQPAITPEQRAAYGKLVDQLQKSIEKAAVAIEQLRSRVSAGTQEVRISRTEVTARSLDLRVARKELKVERISDSGAGERSARTRLEDAKISFEAARKEEHIQSEELGYTRAKLLHARHLKALEEAKLAEAVMRGAGEPPPTEDILKTEKLRVKAEANEARARAVLADAAARVARAKH